MRDNQEFYLYCSFRLYLLVCSLLILAVGVLDGGNDHEEEGEDDVRCEVCQSIPWQVADCARVRQSIPSQVANCH